METSALTSPPAPTFSVPPPTERIAETLRKLTVLLDTVRSDCAASTFLFMVGLPASRTRVPRLTTVPPVKVLAALRVRVPTPSLVNPWVPAIGAPMAAAMFPTVMVGDVTPASSVNVPTPSKTEELYVLPMSPKSIIPTVLDPSSVTYKSPGRVSALKLAVTLLPLATTLFDQLAPVDQKPPAASIQVGTGVVE